jgi:HTH-type transcriptional dual regulator CecR, C-terminal domain
MAMVDPNGEWGLKIVEVIAGLTARITGGDPDDEHVRLQIPQLFGALLFRAAGATVLRELRWDSIGTREFEAVRGMIRSMSTPSTAASIGPDRP